jgi:two-component system sensor histidine kinase ChvG
LKTPLAAIQSSLSPLRRAVALDDQRARRALDIIDSSIARLIALVNSAQRVDSSVADLIEAPRVLVNFTEIAGEVTLGFREIMAARDVRLIRRLDDGVMVRAGRGMLETALQNVLENAISFSPRGGTIVMTLAQRSHSVELQVDDEGPGIVADKIDRVFDRYFSSRPRRPDGQPPDTDAPPATHAGLGLWMVRRNVEMLGGQVTAANRIGGGLSIAIVLPRNGG